MSVYDYMVKDGNGESVKLRDFRGKVLLIVNTATECGFTPQYEELEKLYEKYKDQGFEILDFPCNQFGGQASGSYEEITSFCQLKYGVSFPVFAKVEVNGPQAIPLFKYLKNERGFRGFQPDHKLTPVLKEMLSKENPRYAYNSDIKWNFTKFVVDQKGKVIDRLEPTADMAEVEACIQDLLK